MPIEFRNPLASQGLLLDKLRAMIGRTETGGDAAARPADHGKTAPQGDRVSLSSDARRIVEQALVRTPVSQVDAERIAALKQAIETGSFRIDSDSIAYKVSLQYGSR